MSKTEETAPRRGTFIDPDTATKKLPTVGDVDAVQTIAEARAARENSLLDQLKRAEQIIEEKNEVIEHISLELGETKAALEELKNSRDDVDVNIYTHVPENGDGEAYIVVDLTSGTSDKLKVTLNDGDLYFGYLEEGNEITGEAQALRGEAVEETATQKMVKAFDSYLAIASGGAVSISEQMQGRDPVSRAAWIAQLAHFAKTMHENADNLDKLVQRAHLANAMLEE